MQTNLEDSCKVVSTIVSVGEEKKYFPPTLLGSPAGVLTKATIKRKERNLLAHATHIHMGVPRDE